MGGPYYHRIAKWLYFPGSMANAEKFSVAFSETIGPRTLLKFLKMPRFSSKRCAEICARRATGDNWEIVGSQHLRRCKSECGGQTTRGHVPGVRFEAGAQR
jgi:hypothetical protein